MADEAGAARQSDEEDFLTSMAPYMQPEATVGSKQGSHASGPTSFMTSNPPKRKMTKKPSKNRDPEDPMDIGTLAANPFSIDNTGDGRRVYPPLARHEGSRKGGKMSMIKAHLSQA